MHYIIGTSFVVNPNPKLGIRDKRFMPGKAYSLFNIRKAGEKVTYVFVDQMRQKTEVEFNSCRDADQFISKLKNERIPDYDTRPEEPALT